MRSDFSAAFQGRLAEAHCRAGDGRAVRSAVKRCVKALDAVRRAGAAAGALGDAASLEAAASAAAPLDPGDEADIEHRIRCVKELAAAAEAAEAASAARAARGGPWFVPAPAVPGQVTPAHPPLPLRNPSPQPLRSRSVSPMRRYVPASAQPASAAGRTLDERLESLRQARDSLGVSAY
jgi:hypothetical protein